MQTPTIFIDIDGTIIAHRGNLSKAMRYKTTVLNKEVTLAKFNEWESKGYRIILTTGRPESMRKFTAKQLTREGFFWDQLIMGLGGGPRYLINDKGEKGENKAFAINVDRDKGLAGIGV